MCRECDTLLATAESIVLMSEAEQTLILAEAEAGVSVVGARRPLFPHEVRACVRFGDMNEALEESERQITQLMTDYGERLTDALVDLLPEGITASAAVAIVSQAVQNPPEHAQKIIDDLTADLGDVLAAVRNYGRDAVSVEAGQQGVEFATLDDSSYLKRVRDNVGEVAAGIATALWLAVASRTTRAVNGAVSVTKSAVKASAIGKSIVNAVKDSIDQARQATHDQHNSGRRDGASLMPDPPARIYAGELLDANTCDRCYSIDGFLFETEAEAEEWYPMGGPMSYCLGGKRCRGTLIYDWSDLGEEFDGGVDKDSAPRLPFAHPGQSNETGLPPHPGYTPTRSPLPDSLPDAAKSAFNDYWRLPTAPVTRDDMAVFWKGVFAANAGGLTVSRGGHSPGSKMKGKTKLPKSWTSADFRTAIMATIINPGAIRKMGNTWVLFSYVNGIVFQVRVMVSAGGGLSVVKAYPQSGRGVTRKLKDGRVVDVPGVQLPNSIKDELHYNDSRLEGGS